MDASRLERAARCLIDFAEGEYGDDFDDLRLAFNPPSADALIEGLVALRAALAAPAEDEVVAWAVVDSCGYRSVAFQRPRADVPAHDEEVVPLYPYAHPTPPASAHESLDAPTEVCDGAACQHETLTAWPCVKHGVASARPTPPASAAAERAFIEAAMDLGKCLSAKGARGADAQVVVFQNKYRALLAHRQGGPACDERSEA